jgi:hypothetical protein
MPKGSLDLHAWARLGASQRLREIDQERAAIVKAFPELSGGPARRRPGRPPKNSVVAVTTGTVSVQPKTRKRRPMSAAARKAISEAQKARWAKRRRTAKKAAE